MSLSCVLLQEKALQGRTQRGFSGVRVGFGLMLSCVGGLACVSMYGTGIRYTRLVLAPRVM